MFLHSYFHLLLLELYIHAQKIVLVSSCLRHLPKLFFNRFDYLIDHLWIHVSDIVIIDVPSHCALFSLDVFVYYAQILWFQFKTHVL